MVSPEFRLPKIDPLNGGLRPYPPLASTDLLETRNVMMRAMVKAITAIKNRMIINVVVFVVLVRKRKTLKRKWV